MDNIITVHGTLRHARPMGISGRIDTMIFSMHNNK